MLAETAQDPRHGGGGSADDAGRGPIGRGVRGHAGCAPPGAESWAGVAEPPQLGGGHHAEEHRVRVGPLDGEVALANGNLTEHAMRLGGVAS